ncbi:hypothetical protein [Dysgonomonas sp. 511]|uniref:hypothetical protein n=1 Tax=Dysgonomonas sp. 511 TaxID=2302930 RepID=UPI0016263C65|nr:hypothetical protein [Dysgonomonas sp. 511]
MKKKIIKLSSSVSAKTLSLFTLMALVVLFSCKSSHSVREIKASRNGEQTYIPKPKKIKEPKTKGDAKTKNLFMNPLEPNIELPYADGSDAVVSEQVTYTHAEVITREGTGNAGSVNLSEVQRLNEVVVTAKSRFTPEQDGRINVDFIVKVPKSILSSDYRVTLSPKLIHNDSIIPLENVVLKGQKFADKQKQSYKDFEAYKNSIVSKNKYDSVFVDYDGVRKDIDFYQNYYYGQYHKEWSRQKDYQQWKAQKDESEAYYAAQTIGQSQKAYYEKARKARQQAMKEYAKGKDTTGYFARYMKHVVKPLELNKGRMEVEQREDYRLDFFKEFSRRANEQAMRDWANGKDTTGAYMRYMKAYDRNYKDMVLDGEDLKKIPKRFRDIYRSGRNFDQLDSKSVSAEDSIAIAQLRYLFDKIALNDMKLDRLDDKMNEIIIFPYETNVRVDSVVQTDKDIAYYYKQDYPVLPGMRKLRLVMNSRVDAVDQSRFDYSPSDTLSYFISSLSQLVDTTLITKTTTIHRDVYNTMLIYPKFLPNKFNFNVKYQDNKEQTEKVAEAYKTFTEQGNLLIDSIEIRVSTSLDGDYEKNIELTMKRSEALAGYFAKTFGTSKDLFKLRYIGEDWSSMVRLIVKRNDMPNKQAVLDMITQAVYPDQTEKDMQKEYPQDYKILKDSIYPMLNKADIIFNMTRPGMTEEITVNSEVRPEYAKALQYLQDREYWKALDILSDFPADYNTALCLVCMGYNNKALEVLEKLPETGNNEYLLAILSIRANDEDSAIAHLIKACELDPTKAYRAPLDPEIAALVKKHNLQDRLIEGSNVSDQTIVEEELKTGEQTETAPAAEEQAATIEE